MKYFSILFVAFIFMSCGGDSDFLTIEEYITANNIETEVTASGLHYILETDNPDAEKPALSSEITIDYTGYFLDGGIFDRGTDVTFPLDGLILGWQEGIQLMGRGDRMTLLIPSNLAYGSRGSGSIPGNTDIGFDITLHDFSN